jgi:anaerobic dimethyl sulfoxide reductase subunit B (iron-sulfur subunit)
MNYKIYFDKNKCTGCGSCAVTCMDEYNINPRNAFRKMYQNEYLKDGMVQVDFYAINCQHCEEPDCLVACPKNCFYKDQETGLILLDKGACIGCGNCSKKCKFGAITYNRCNKAVKCNGCFERIKEKQAPKCVEDCFVQALVLKEMIQAEHEAYLMQLGEEINPLITRENIRRSKDA